MKAQRVAVLPEFPRVMKAQRKAVPESPSMVEAQGKTVPEPSLLMKAQKKAVPEPPLVMTTQRKTVLESPKVMKTESRTICESLQLMDIQSKVVLDPPTEMKEHSQTVSESSSILMEMQIKALPESCSVMRMHSKVIPKPSAVMEAQSAFPEPGRVMGEQSKAFPEPSMGVEASCRAAPEPARVVEGQRKLVPEPFKERYINIPGSRRPRCKFSVLYTIVSYLRERHLKTNTDPLTIEDILDNTDMSHIHPKVKEWLVNEALPHNPKVEVTNGQHYLFKPPLSVTNKRSLLKFLRRQHRKGLGGVKVSDVQESLPSWEKVMKRLKEELYYHTRKMDKSQIIFYKDKTVNLPVEDELIQLWWQISLVNVSDIHIEKYCRGEVDEELRPLQVFRSCGNRPSTTNTANRSQPKKKPPPPLAKNTISKCNKSNTRKKQQQKEQ